MKRTKTASHCLSLCLGLSLVVGCVEEYPIDPAPDNVSGKTTVDGAAYLLQQEPSGAQEVIAVRESAKDGDEITIVGRIGGEANPWIDGRAAFTIVDGSLKACSDIPGDQCAKPWDYCCETDKLPTARALVKVVDGDGAVVEADARKLLQVKELSTVIVQGKAKRDDAGNLTVLASGIFVKK